MTSVDSRGTSGARSWAYWAACVAAFAFLIVDIFDDGAIWNYAVILFVIIAIATRPGGVRGSRRAAATDDAAADDTAPHAT
jgi:hypothetical protein